MLESTGYSFLGNAAIAAGLAILSVFTGERRGVYLSGLSAAFIASCIALLVIVAVRVVFPHGAPRLMLPFIDPTIEEPLRIGFLSAGAVALATSKRSTGAALAFAIGYAVFETVLKALGLVLMNADILSGREMILMLTGPMVVLALHLTLGLLAASLFARGVRFRTVLLTTFIVHAAHNASVFWLPRPTDLPAFAIENLARIGIFVPLISYCLLELRTRDKLHSSQI